MASEILTARADANHSMGYVHKLRLESHELTNLEGLEISTSSQPSWNWLIAKWAVAVVLALSLLWSVGMTN